jgi:hypothetical protein
MPLMLGTIERQHALTNDTRGRESEVVDGEHDWISHDLQREISARNDPGIERRYP